MKNKLKPITVYWSTPSYLENESSWHFLYREPESLFKNVYKIHSDTIDKKETLFACPAFNDHASNVFVFSSAIDDTINIQDGVLDNFLYRKKDVGSEQLVIPTDSKLILRNARQSSLTGYVSVSYNMSWILFSDEPLVAKFIAPYYPQTSPCEGSLLSVGKFDIGKIYRPFQLDYHIPLKTKQMVFKKEDPLFYVEFETDRPIIFKRYEYSFKLDRVVKEVIKTYSQMFGQRIPLSKRYEDAKMAKIPELVLSEIRKNLVE